MNAPAELRTERCLLRPATMDDLGALESAVRSPEFPSDLPLAALCAQDRLGHWLKEMCDRAVRGHGWIWSVQLHERPQCIGQISLLRIPEANAWRLAFWLNPTHWRRGLAQEAIAAVLQEAFAVQSVPEIRAGAALWNRRSLGTLERAGLRAMSVVEDGYRIGGVSQAIREHAVTRDEWLQGRALRVRR